MAWKCTICVHRQRSEIDRMLVAAGASLQDIADRFEVSRSSLDRHKKNHLPAHLAVARKAKEVISADDLLSRLTALNRETLAILHEARCAENGCPGRECTSVRELIRETTYWAPCTTIPAGSYMRDCHIPELHCGREYSVTTPVAVPTDARFSAVQGPSESASRHLFEPMPTAAALGGGAEVGWLETLMSSKGAA